MTKRNTVYRLLASVLAVSLQSMFIPVVADVQTATVSGKILSADTSTPLTGVKLHVGNPLTGDVFTSPVTSADGSYTIGDLPPATYELAVEANGGLYLVGPPVQLAPGQARSLNLAVNPEKTPRTTAGEGAAGGWDSPLWAALIVVGSAIVIGVLIDEATQEDDVSPSTLPE